MKERMERALRRREEYWSAISSKKRACLAAALLSGAIAALFVLLFAILPLTGNGLIFKNDDYQQHYPFLMAIGRWLRSFFANPGKASWFDFSLGFGADWLASLNYYGVGDPLTLLAALFDEPHIYACYVLLVALRHVLAGLAFLAMCREFGVRYRGALIAAAAYAFTNYMVAWCALCHPMFANPVIHLPLMVLGAERRLKGKSPWALILSTAWSAMCGFYFLYMNSLMLMLFALVRHFVLCGGDRPWRRLPGAFLRCALPYLLGLGLAAAMLIPGLLGYLGCSRDGLRYAPNLLSFQPDVYWAFPISFIASNGWLNAMTVPVAAMFALCAMLKCRKSHRALTISTLLVMLALLIPVVGWIFNGFSYVSDRWKYAGLLLLLYVFARFSEPVARGEIGRGLCAGLLIWCAVLLARWKFLGAAVPHVMLILLAALLCLGGLVDLALARRIQRRLTEFPRLRQAASSALLAAFVAVNLFANATVICADLILNNSPDESAWARRSDTSLTALPESDGEFFRTDLTSAEYFQYNAPSVTGTASTSVYSSIRPAVMARFMGDLELNTEVSANRVHGLDSRAALEAILSVRYLTAPSGTTAAIPYGFAPLPDDGQYAIWENTLALPAAWTVSTAMLREEYDALDPLRKQWVLLQCAVLDQPDARFAAASPIQTVQNIPWRVAQTENARFEDGQLSFGNGGGSVTLSFDGAANSETYLRLTGVTCDDPNAAAQNYLTLTSGEQTGMMIYPSDSYDYSLHRTSFLNHLGYSQAPRTSLTLTSTRALRLNIDSAEILCQPMGDFAAMVEARREGVLSVTRDGDRFDAEVDLNADGMVVFSIPFSSGWRAKIDDSPAKLESDAGALCLVKVPAGQHRVTLSYETPGLRIGLLLTALSLLATLVWAAARKVRRK